MLAWRQSDHTPFLFYDAHDINYARDTSLEYSIKSQLRIRLANTKAFIVLVGQNTRYLYKFVKWEMEQAINLNLPIIVVNLNGMRQQDPDRCPPILRDELAVHISFNSRILQRALEEWPQMSLSLKNSGRAGPFFYNEQAYRSLGL
ncbi:TIR domain-containing protein [Burkholderia cepacia]|uniref:TIR domain-containing protein n=1 Tax=Burkholderia cepacia TaxID=292 RepID=UPI0020196985|nr:TIR domain-containing protein [Burkholderia cepacia]UQO38927.1 TIR domain-containing protein [Burkholderia cepacia]UQO53259.1 TIR domain-containing protein [Burkholderia cepacia]UQP07407.1 TIR domain-containing protein [Burkholderia cepacia]